MQCPRSTTFVSKQNDLDRGQVILSASEEDFHKGQFLLVRESFKEKRQFVYHIYSCDQSCKVDTIQHSCS